MRVEAERRGDWVKVAEMYRRYEQIRTQKRLERQAYLARKRKGAEVRKRCNFHTSSDNEI